jgi:hypothetical protein
MCVTAERTSKMDDIEARVKDIIAQYGDLAKGSGPQAQELKKKVQAFIEHGPGMPELRRQALLRYMKGWDSHYRDFLMRRGGGQGRCE